MYKLSLLLALSTVLALSPRAQSFEVGTNNVGAGIGLGSSLNGTGSSSSTPAISLHYDRGIWKAGPGVISLGAYVGYKGYKYSDEEITEKWNWTIVGLRGAWHYTDLKVDNLDLYGGLMLSYNHLSWSYTNNTNGVQENNGSSGPPFGSDMALTAFVGAKYYFVPNLSVFAELGYGVADLNLGLALKF